MEKVAFNREDYTGGTSEAHVYKTKVKYPALGLELKKKVISEDTIEFTPQDGSAKYTVIKVLNDWIATTDMDITREGSTPEIALGRLLHNLI